MRDRNIGIDHHLVRETKLKIRPKEKNSRERNDFRLVTEHKKIQELSGRI